MDRSTEGRHERLQRAEQKNADGDGGSRARAANPVLPQPLIDEGYPLHVRLPPTTSSPRKARGSRLLDERPKCAANGRLTRPLVCRTRRAGVILRFPVELAKCRHDKTRPIGWWVAGPTT